MKSFNTFREGGFRRRWPFPWALAASAVLCFIVSAAAEDQNRTSSEYLHDFWGPEKGFPVGSVSTIAQTPDGYLWIGTDKGLVRFDGFDFRRFEQAKPGSLAIGSVRALLADGHRNLWILLQDTSLFRYHEGTFELSRGLAENGVTAMTLGPAGQVVLSSLAMGALTYDGKQFVAALPAPVADSRKAVPGEVPDERSARFSWTYGNMPDRLAAGTSAVISAAATTDGKIWLGTEDKGLFYLRDGRLYAPANGLFNAKINCLLPLENSELWIGTSMGMLRWNGTELTRQGVPSALEHAEVLSMIRDRDSIIWVGTSSGLLRFDVTGVSFFPREVPGTARRVTALFEDREGNLWIGSPWGIERLRRGAFVSYSGLGLQSESSGPIYVDPEGRTWFASVRGGLRWLQGEKNGTVTIPGVEDRDVAYSIGGSSKEVWIGWQRSGLTRLNYNRGATRAQNYKEADGLAQNSVYVVYQSRDGTVWAGTLSGGVSRFDGRRFVNYTTGSGLASNTVTSILETQDGAMWFGTANGLNSFSRGQWRRYATEEGLPSADVNCLYEDSSGKLWMGTSGGLAFFGSGHVQVPENLPAVFRGNILGIAEDKQGWFWIATADHVLRVQGDKMATGTLGVSDLREYGAEDGLRSTEGVKRSRSVVSDPSGRIWFSLSRGLSVVDPSRVTETSAPAIPQIEALSADGSPLNLENPVHLPPSPKRITFTFTGLSLAFPERLRFRYFLEGFDREWSEPVATREAVYTNLGAGSYRFRVVASNSAGIWKGSEAAVGFEVEPTLWQTRWFRIGFVIAALLLVWGAHRYRLYQLTQQFNLRFEERVGERTRIARDLHDTLLQSFHGLLLRFQAVSNLLPTRPREAKERLDEAIDQAEQAITEGRDAVQGLRASAAAPNDLALALGTLGQELASSETGSHSPEFQVEVEGAPRELHAILRDEVYRIAGEALRNAFRHAQARRIEVEIHYDERQLRLRIRDDGKGMETKLADGAGRPGHWGLRGMRERAKVIGGNLELWSNVESGTEIELTIPASVAYAGANPRRRSWFSGKRAAMSD